MQSIVLDAVDSTSSEAHRRLQAGEQAPFAIIAAAQTAGRGRRGKQWASPKGNLYMTLVLPARHGETAGTPSEELMRSHGYWPLKAGVLIARFIRAEVGLRVTLKWPNDLLVQGKKLGGLLLEAGVKGNEPSEVMIGIGLNLNIAPEIEGDYATTALAGLMGEGAIDTQAFGQRLATFIADEWGGVASDAVAKAYGEFAVADGELWRDLSKNVWRRGSGLSPIGGLVLRPWPAAGGGDVEELTSAEHGYTWALQGRSGDDQPLVIADVGNTRIKLACYEGASQTQPSATWSCAVAEAEAALPQIFCALVERLVRRPALVHVVSVRPEAAAMLTIAAAGVGLSVQPVDKRPVRVHGDAYPLTDLGIDRLCAMEGFVHQQGSAAHGVVLSAGTATTIDVLSKRGQHLGGYILPGIDLALSGLHHATGLLPAVDPRTMPIIEQAALGHDTRSALYQGILVATAGAVRLACDLAGGGVVDVVLTGGNATLLAPLVNGRIVPDLIMQGARLLVRS